MQKAVDVASAKPNPSSVDDVIEEVESGEMKPPFVDGSPSIKPNQTEAHLH
jgi:hypothetical protein